MRSFSNKSCRRKPKCTFYIQQLFSENRAVDEIMSTNTVEPERRRRVACRISKATRAQALTRARTSTQINVYTHMHAPRRAHPHTHTQRNM